ncbi:SRPBCC family protein [Streptomyces sp. NPDC059631]|uniref:SRPBCC family protein n=1 Tax=unclassified Streptomyces TaxID=2593676 RepID=UPI0036A41A33
MELHHAFTVPVPADDAWRALLDIEGVAPCLPGAVVESYDGRTVTGSVTVRLGPVTVAYKGTAVFEEQDARARRMVLVASGRETRGQGTARATVTAALREREGATEVAVDTDLTVTGRPAQFGRGVLAEVGDRLVGRFADCLALRLAGAAPGKAAPAAAEGTAGSAAESTAESVAGGREAEPLDLLREAGVPLARRAAAAAGAVVAAVLLVAGVRRLRSAGRRAGACQRCRWGRWGR